MTRHAPPSRPPVRLTRNRLFALLGSLAVIAAALVIGIGGLARENAPTPLPAPTPTPPIPRDLAPEAVVDPPYPSLTYGLQAFLWWNETMRTIDLDNIRLMKFSHIKQRFFWPDVQPARDQWVWDKADGVVDEVQYRGMQLIARLDGAPDWAMSHSSSQKPGVPPVDLDAWGTYCGTLAARYKGRIAGYEVWNEPNLRREWFDYPPDAAAYVSLLKTCAQAIRAADPGAVIISAGLAPTGTQLPEAIPDIDYLRMMYTAGASPWFDVLGLNAPGYKAPPDLSPDDAEKEYGQRWMCFRHVEDMRAIMVAEGEAHKQVALLEVGWTIDPRPDSPYHWHAVTQEQQAEYLVGAYRYAAQHWRPWVGPMITIYIADITWTPDDEEYWWAINIAGYDWGWQGRPAYYKLANMDRYIDDQFIPARDPSAPDAAIVAPLPPRTPHP